MTPDLTWWAGLAVVLVGQTALVVGVAWLVAFKIRAPQARRSVWQAAILGLAVIWLGEIVGVGERTRSFWPHQIAPAIMLPTPPVSMAPGDTGGMPLQQSPRSVPSQTISAVKWPGTVWLVGTSLLLLRLIANRSWIALQRRKMKSADFSTQETAKRLSASLGLSRVEVRVWSQIRGPMAFGWWRPTVALPDDFLARFSAAQRDAMLAHELAHLAARDPRWLLLTDVVFSLAWWNPLMWLAARRLHEACETAADEASALLPTGPVALAESLLHFGRELAVPPMIRGLGIVGNGFRSNLGRRVNTLLSFQGQWRGLSSRWRWCPRIAVVIVALITTSIPLWPSPPGSLAGWLVESASAESTTQTDVSPVATRAYPASKVAGSNVGPLVSVTVGESASNSPQIVLITLRFVSVREGAPAQAALDKLFTELAPDESASPDAVAQFFKDSKISHTENFHVDYHVTRDRMAKLTDLEFKKTLNSVKQSEGTDILSAPRVQNSVGQPARIAVQDIQTIVTGISPPGQGTVVGATNGFWTEPLNTGVTADLVAGLSADGWDLSVLCRRIQFLGYDKPDSTAKSAVTIPLPHISIDDIQGKVPLPPDQTLVLRGPLETQTDKVTDTTLGVFHTTHVNTVHTRLYIFVTPTAVTNPPPSAPR